MKSKFILQAAVFVFIFTSHVSATENVTECNVDLPKGTKREKLNQTLRCLQNQIKKLSVLIDDLNPKIVPTGTIVAMNRSCPPEWSNYDTANGKYIVGSNSTGKFGGTEFTIYKNIGQIKKSPDGQGETTFTIKEENIEGEQKIAGNLMKVPLEPAFITFRFCQKN